MNELDYTKQIKAILKRYGDEAAEHFGVAKGTLANYMRTGRYPLKLVEKILAEQSPSGAVPSQSGPVEKPLAGAPLANGGRAAPEATLESRVELIEEYLQKTVDFYLRQFAEHLAKLDMMVSSLHVEHLRHTGLPSLARPDQGLPAEQTFTTNPRGNALDTGIAPTKEMVDAQARMMTVEGVPVPNAQVAGPAVQLPNQPAFGFGWNLPRSK